MSPNFGGLGLPILRGVTSPLARYSSTQRCAVRTATSGTTALTRTPERSEFQCHRLGDPDDPVLRRGIGEAVGHAPDPGRRAEVHNCRLCLRFPHGAGGSLAHVETCLRG